MRVCAWGAAGGLPCSEAGSTAGNLTVGEWRKYGGCKHPAPFLAQLGWVHTTATGELGMWGHVEDVQMVGRDLCGCVP